jgi:predicted  nucleic acid-binding Zn-ribbon protein
MSKNLKETVSGIEYKCRVLIHKYNTLREEFSALQEENAQLKEQISRHDEKLVRLKQDQQAHSIADSLENSKGSEEARLKIDELVREIDKCIQLLNN